MPKQIGIKSLVVLGLGLLLNTAARAQVQGGGGMDPDMQEMMQMGMQMFQRMQASGIDLQQMAQQAQSDPQGLQQMLIDKGIIDSDMMTRMQKTGQRMLSRILKEQLVSTDEEWNVLSPKVDRVLAAATAAGGSGGVQMPMMGGANKNDPVTKALELLRAEIKQTGTTDSKITIKLQEVREVVANAKAELKTAREELRAVLTVRQEAILINFGLLD